MSKPKVTIPMIEHTEILIFARLEENLYVGTSAHEILHFVLLPPTEPGTPIAATLDPPEFPTQKPSYILASRIQPPLTSGATPHSREPYIKNILLLPGPGKILVLSSTGLLSFWSYPELSPAYGGSVKVASTNFIGALDLNDLGIDEVEADSYASTTGSVGKKLGRPRVENSKMVMVITKKTVKMVRVKEEESRLVKVRIKNFYCSRKGLRALRILNVPVS